jgi:hypothetical protein
MISEQAYGGFVGGLYPNGTNVRPTGHEAAGAQMAGDIKPLNSLGQIDSANGRIGFVAIGMSSTKQEFEVFEFDSAVDAFRDPRIVTINGAQDGQTAFQWADPNGAPWSQLATIVSGKGLTSAQVQVAWIKLTVDGTDVGGWGSYPPFPSTASLLQSKLRQVVRNLKLYYQISGSYLPAIYGKYATNGVRRNPSPMRRA